MGKENRFNTLVGRIILLSNEEFPMLEQKVIQERERRDVEKAEFVEIDILTPSYYQRLSEFCVADLELSNVEGPVCRALASMGIINDEKEGCRLNLAVMMRAGFTFEKFEAQRGIGRRAIVALQFAIEDILGVKLYTTNDEPRQ